MRRDRVQKNVRIPFQEKVLAKNSRKIWNSTNERLRRVIWRCNSKYAVKGEKGCESRHVDERVLYQAFINTFNAVVENRENYLREWRSLQSSEDILRRVTAKRFIRIFSKAELIDQFDVDLYFKLVEKISVYDSGVLVVSLLDGSGIECVIE